MNRRELFTQGAISACGNLLGAHTIESFREHLGYLQKNSDAMAKNIAALRNSLDENVASINKDVANLRGGQRQIIGAMIVIVLIG